MAYIQERKAKDGKTHYRVIVRLKGHPTQCATFQRKTDAVKWISDTESAMRHGRHFQTAESKKHTLKKLIERYECDYLPKKQDKQEGRLRWWKEKIGHLFLADITPALVAELRDKLSKGTTRRHLKRSPATVVRYLSALSHVFTIAVKEYGWVSENPILKVTKPKMPRGRIRFLDEEERTALLEECKKSKTPFLYSIVVLALSTGMRRGEILNLQWRDIDFQKGRITLHKTKNGEIRVVPLKGHAFEVIQQFYQTQKTISSYLFPSKKVSKPIDIRSSWERAVKRAEIQDFHFHDLRHCTASYLAMNGASLAEIAEVLGHKTLQMVKRYAHLSENHMSKVIENMNEKIFG